MSDIIIIVKLGFVSGHPIECHLKTPAKPTSTRSTTRSSDRIYGHTTIVCEICHKQVLRPTAESHGHSLFTRGFGGSSPAPEGVDKTCQNCPTQIKLPA